MEAGSRIADSVAAALVSMLTADFAHIVVPGRHDEPSIEATSFSKTVAADLVGAIRAALRRELPLQSIEQAMTIANPIGEGSLRVAHQLQSFHPGVSLKISGGKLSRESPRPEPRATERTGLMSRWVLVHHANRHQSSRCFHRKH